MFLLSFPTIEKHWNYRSSYCLYFGSIKVSSIRYIFSQMTILEIWEIKDFSFSTEAILVISCLFVLQFYFCKDAINFGNKKLKLQVDQWKIWYKEKNEHPSNKWKEETVYRVSPPKCFILSYVPHGTIRSFQFLQLFLRMLVKIEN